MNRYVITLVMVLTLSGSRLAITNQDPDLDDFGETFIGAEPLANILFAYDDPGAVVSIPERRCANTTEILGEFTKADCINNQGGTFGGLPYGDLVAPFGVVNILDILCVLDEFTNPGSCPSADLDPCEPNGNVDVNDLIAVLEAFVGNPGCASP